MKVTELNFVKVIMRKEEKGLLYVVDEYGWIIQSVVRKSLFRIPDYEEECINDVLLAIWEGIEGFQPEISTFKNWVAGIARFKAIDYKRKYLKKFTECSLIDDYEIKDEYAERQMIQIELQEEIKEILDQLSEKDRKIFEMVYIDEKTIDDVAEQIGMKKDTIYQRISRARKKIRGNKLVKMDVGTGR